MKPDFWPAPLPVKAATQQSMVNVTIPPALFKVGEWNERSGVNFTRNFTESYTEIVESLQNKTLVVTTVYVSKQNLTFTLKLITSFFCNMLKSF